MSKKILGVTLYTMDEVSDLLGVTIKTIQKYVKEGRLPYTLIGGKSYISEDTLKNYLTEGRNRAKGE
jgi:excisionase family DNA binding protein